MKKLGLWLLLSWATSTSNLLADSLTISPIGLSHHGKSNEELSSISPRKLDRLATWTWHPEFNLIYKTKYTQSSVFYMQDTIDRPIAGATFGLKYPIFNYFDVGGVLGAMGRQPRATGFPDVLMGNVQILPVFGATFSARLPITKHISIETNLLLNGVLDHGIAGLRFDW